MSKTEKKVWSYNHIFALVTLVLVITGINMTRTRALMNDIEKQDNQIIGVESIITSVLNPTLNKLSGKIIGPQINPDGATTHLVEWPTISAVLEIKSSGNPSRDAIALIIPTGTPWYGAEAGVNFDDPIAAQKRWGQMEALELTPDQQSRWEKITSLFTCDYCCGGPSRVTVIARCGCAHARAWRGMAKFFLKFYGEKYSDEEILGELTRWKGLWYPKGMVEDYLVYVGAGNAANLRHGGSDGIKAQFAGQTGTDTSASASLSGLDNLPGMVGGC